MDCGAKKRDGTPCRAPAMPNGRCRIHGGKTPSGLASPNLRTGRYSKYLPARLIGRYQEATSDPALLELREEVALLDARLTDLLGRVETGESGEVWKLLRVRFAEFNEAKAAGKVPDMQAALYQIEGLITRGLADYAAWGEIGSVLEQRRRLVESERKRLVEMQQTITTERAMLLIGAIGGIIKAHVTDRTQLEKISQDIGALLDRPAGGGAELGG